MRLLAEKGEGVHHVKVLDQVAEGDTVSSRWPMTARQTADEPAAVHASAQCRSRQVHTKHTTASVSGAQITRKRMRAADL